MKRTLLICIIILIIVLGVLFLKKNNNPVEYENTEIDSMIAKFIINHLFDKDKTLRTNFSEEPGRDLALSESMGLWLEYLAANKKQEQFNQVYDTIKKEFMLKQGLIAWKVEDGEIATTNALIDDIRIIEALFIEGEDSGQQMLIDEAIKLSEAILKYNYNGKFLVDFYDWEYGYSNEELTLSYLNLTPFIYMKKYNVISEEFLQEIEQFLKLIPKRDNFYPMTYHVTNETFEFSEEINLIDQLYIALHLERASVNTDEFYEWLLDKESIENKLYGRYDASTEEPTVNYESVAVYALTVLYALEREDKEFAKRIWQVMKEFQVRDISSDYYGGYVLNYQTHSFDNLLALLAEEELQHEEIIQ